MTHSIIKPGSSYQFQVSNHYHTVRLDLFLAEQFPGYSRSFIKKIIEDKLVTVNSIVIEKAGSKVKCDDRINITIPYPVKKEITSEEVAQLGVSIVFQNNDFAIINKPAGLIVHSERAANTAPTLVAWIEHTFSTIQHVGYKDRPGIVHRLDKETSGLMVIPLTNQAFAVFGTLFRKRTIKKTYLAVVKGTPPTEGLYTGSIARHQTIRNKMTIHSEGKEARTDFTTLAYFKDAALVQARPQTGRTHQIRVHFGSAGHGLIGDPLYGVKSPLIKRHALHAHTLDFNYNAIPYTFSAPIPDDLQQLIVTLEKDNFSKK